MKKCYLIFIAGAAVALLACSPDKSAQPRLLEEQRGALNKAKEVEALSQQQADQLKQNLEKQAQ